MKKTLVLVALIASISCLGFGDLFAKQPGEDEFKCEPSGKIIPKSFVNDDFCDCEEDGSDEPLTGACPNGKFVCDSHDESLLQTLHSSQVNDGICDCCDGTDEMRKEIMVCENTCDSKMKILFAEKIEQMERYNAGKAIRDEWVKIGKEAKEKRSEKLAELEKEKQTEDEKLERLEKEKEREEEEEKKEKEGRREEEDAKFKEALKLTTLSTEQLRDAVVRVVSTKSKATEALIECYSSFDVEVDDVSALSASIAISDGFAFEELNDAERALSEAEGEFERSKRKETQLVRKRNQAEQSVKEAERELEKEKEKEKEREREKKEGGKEEGEEERMERVRERLKKMKARSLKKQAEEHDDDHPYQDHDDHLENTHGVITSTPTQTLLDAQEKLTQAIEDWEHEQSLKEEKENLVKDLEKRVESLKGEEEGLREEWEREKYGEFEKALEVVEDGEVVGGCLWASVKEGGLSRELLKFLSQYGIEEQQDLVAPEENLHFSRDSAESARKAAQECSRNVNDLHKKIDDLKSEADFDFGEEEEYFELFGKCFDTRADKYKYTFCPFKNAKQDSTGLGDFASESWATDKSVMKFERGRYCMDKDRQASVYFECGKENEIIKVSEPERCEYNFYFRTPAACSAPPH